MPQAMTSLQFVRDGRLVSYIPPSPTQTVLDYLRLAEKSRGTKEGCNEGDCGACTVALGRLRDGKLVYEPVNSCICLIGQLHGAELVTVEDLADGDRLHPVQQAMVDHHASQCGFCTPGFVMALFTLYQQGSGPTRQQIVDHLAGNLCRCTGYRPIIDAALAACSGDPLDKWAKNAPQTAQLLSEIKNGADVFIACDDGFLAIPASAATLTALYAEHPDATLVAGATDVGLWVTKQLRSLPKIIHASHVASLHQIEEDATHLRIGAAATYAESWPALAALDADSGEILRRIGSGQVRASGTIGGNIANGSPIGDMPPLLIALGATLVLRHGGNERSLPLEDFFIAYGRQDRKAGELVWRIDIPTLKTGQHLRTYKISKRFDQDISALMAAFNLTVAGGIITAARMAFGGMAATPKRARGAEQALLGAKLDERATWQPALEALGLDFEPLSDMRASAAYRRETAMALLEKALLEIGGATATRLIGPRGRVA